MPAIASCSINADVCTPSQKEIVLPSVQQSEHWYNENLKSKIMLNKPNQGPTGAASNYNSNCQFGICLPGVMSEPILDSEK